MKYSRHIFIGIALVVSLILAFQQQRIQDLQNDKKINSMIAFGQQMQPGFACGLLTSKEAASFLERSDIGTSGTIIPADSPTAGTRLGSPRVDSCTHTTTDSNISYMDVVVKTYQSEQDAEDAYAKDMQKVMNTKPGNLTTETVQDTYTSGAHYIQKGQYIYEISASKTGSSNGQSLEAFSDSVANFVLSKL